MSFSYLEATIADIHAAIRRNDIDVAHLVAGYLNRIKAFDEQGPQLNSVVTVNPEAHTIAQNIDDYYRANGKFIGPLHGMPVLVKDQAETAGIKTSFGSQLFADYEPAEDAAVIAKLKAAGAIILGKTTMPDFATAWFSTSSRTEKSLNPYDLSRDPGGSSSGTGAAVAANLCAIGLGEDTGGSIRLPSSFNNLVGLKVTPGLISRRGLSPLVGFQDSAGPMCRTVEDAAKMLNTITGFDAADPITATAVMAGQQDYTRFLNHDALKGRKIAVLRQAFGDDADGDAAAVNQVIETALQSFATIGADVVDIHIPELDHYVEYTSLYVTHSRHDLDAFLSARPALKDYSVSEIYNRKQYEPSLDLFEEIAQGPSDPYSEAEYYERYTARETFQRIIVNALALVGAEMMVFPTSQIAAPTHQDLATKRWTTLTFPTNTLIAAQSWLPAVSVPSGFTTNGLPVGLEIVGLPNREAELLGGAYAFEQATRWRRSPASTPELA